MPDKLNFDFLKDRVFTDSPLIDSDSGKKPRWATHACGARWKNSERAAHCPDCHVTFTADSGFEAHRYGPYDRGRQCRGTDELTALGWTSKPGEMLNESPTAILWSMPAASESPWGRAAK